MVAESFTEKKFFTPAKAEAMLPLVRSIVRDISDLAHGLRDRHDRLNRLQHGGVGKGLITESQFEEEQAAWDHDSERLKECIAELTNLGVEIKDLYVGLVDFPCRSQNREVCLCWKLGEAKLEWWHEIDAGFAGRKPLASLTADSV
jgi:hypothetical protein